MFKKLWLVGLPFFLFSQNIFANTKYNFDEYEALEYEERLEFKKFLINQGWFYSTNSTEKNAYINYNHIKLMPNNKVEAWVKYIIFNDLTKDGMTVGDYTMTLSMYDCTAETYKNISSIDYQKKTGKVLNTYKVPSYKSEYESVIPDTVGETVLNDVCSFAYIKQN